MNSTGEGGRDFSHCDLHICFLKEIALSCFCSTRVEEIKRKALNWSKTTLTSKQTKTTPKTKQHTRTHARTHARTHTHKPQWYRLVLLGSSTPVAAFSAQQGHSTMRRQQNNKNYECYMNKTDSMRRRTKYGFKKKKVIPVVPHSHFCLQRHCQ